MFNYNKANIILYFILYIYNKKPIFDFCYDQLNKLYIFMNILPVICICVYILVCNTLITSKPNIKGCFFLKKHTIIGLTCIKEN